MRRSCKNCDFWHQDDPGELYGSCRRYPPKVLIKIGTIFTDPRDYSISERSYLESEEETVFPETYGNYWCGEYATKGGSEWKEE